MADHDRRQGRSVEEQLRGDASRFTFLQAVRLIEEMAMREGLGRRKLPCESAHEENEIVFFRHKVRLDHPDTDVESLEPGDDCTPPRLTVNVLGLAGVLGPLPHTVTEAILHQLRRGKRAFADFLDVFNHRLISLLYRARKKYRPALDPTGPHNSAVARVLLSLIGLGTPHLRGRVLGRDGDRSLLAYAGLIAERYRSPVGLERVVENCFGVPAEVVPFLGAWEEIDDADRTAIGTRFGRNNRLGKTAIAGKRIWNQAAKFELRLGPLDFKQFRSFLPSSNDAGPSLTSLVRFYAHEELGFNVRLILRHAEVPRLKIKRDGDAFLGHTTWLSTRPPEHDDAQVRLAGER